jgi:hypothetical protein
MREGRLGGGSRKNVMLFKSPGIEKLREEVLQ